MKRINKILALVLAAQLAVVLVIGAAQEEPGVRELSDYLPGFDAAKITAMTVYGPTGGDDAASAGAADGKSGTDGAAPVAELEKTDSGWVVASHYNYPADTKKVDDTLSKLAALRSRGPVTTNASRHGQLKVSGDSYERRLVLKGEGDALTDLYVGSSPGFRKVHVRVAEQEDTHAVNGLSAWDVGQAVSNWVNTEYFKIPGDDIVSLIVENSQGVFEFTRAVGAGDDGWRVVQPAGVPVAGKELDLGKLKGSVRNVANIRLLEPVGTEPTAALGFDSRLARIQIKTEKLPPPAPPAPPSDIAAAVEEAAAAAEGAGAAAAAEAAVPGQPGGEAGEAAAPAPADGTMSVAPERHEYEIVVAAESDGNYVISASGKSHVVETSASSLRALVELKVDDLYKEEPAADAGN